MLAILGDPKTQKSKKYLATVSDICVQSTIYYDRKHKKIKIFGHYVYF